MQEKIRLELIEALEKLGDNQWEAAHVIVDAIQHPKAFEIHGLLHRIEGDQSNAQYWYNRAGVRKPDESFMQERKRILESLFEAKP